MNPPSHLDTIKYHADNLDEGLLIMELSLLVQNIIVGALVVCYVVVCMLS